MTNTSNDDYTEMTLSIKVANEFLNTDLKYSNEENLTSASTNLKNILMLYPTSTSCKKAHELLRIEIAKAASEEEYLSDAISTVV